MELDELVDAADAIQAGEEITDRMRTLLRAGSSPGGARPKALVRADGRLWLVKMPASKDEADVVRLEAATLRLAAGAGLTVPANRLAFLNDGVRSKLMWKRVYAVCTTP